jgi:hypothetical protein
MRKNKEIGMNKSFEESEFFEKMIAKKAATAVNIAKCSDEDLSKAKMATIEAFRAMGAIDPLQLMLSAQMLSIHELQQRMVVYSLSFRDESSIMAYVNLAVKLSNVYVQQAALMQKLHAGSTVTVGEVHVHDGGQAVVGKVEVKN